MGSSRGNVEAGSPHRARSLLIHRAAVPIHAVRIVEDTEARPRLRRITSVLQSTPIPLPYRRETLVEGHVAISHSSQLKECRGELADHTASSVLRSRRTWH